MLITTSPKGTQDLLPSESYKWQYLERNFKDVCDSFGYREIRMPTFEHTELFERGVGDTTDVVEKQMYTFLDKGGRSVTLRPEGTASVARSFLQNNLYALPMPAKMFYNIPCFRYENKQKGRLREFHQFGVEAFGAKGPDIDGEIISLAVCFLEKIGLKDITVHINSIGCKKCRKEYNDMLRDFLRPRLEELCETCKGRFDRNPLRILDCKSEICQKLAEGAPVLLDHICDECREHFEGLKATLEMMGIGYEIDNGIVRGLDYYSKSVFEIISGEFTVCGGGRYDGLIEEFGGEPTPGIGFGLGIERLLIRLEENGVEIPDDTFSDIYLAPLGEKAGKSVPGIVYTLRKQGIKVETDLIGRGLRAQMKYADKIGARYTIVLGDNEIESGDCEIKNMITGEKASIKINEISDYIRRNNN